MLTHLLTYLVNIDIDNAVFRQYRIDITSKHHYYLPAWMQSTTLVNV